MNAAGIKDYLSPETVDEALHMAGNHPNSSFVAGGTDLMYHLKQDNLRHEQVLIDISRIPQLNEIEVKDGALHLGATCTLKQIINNKEIVKHIPALAEAAEHVASPLIRNTATIGGNLMCENRCIYYNQSGWWRDAIGNCLKCDGDRCIATGGKKACFSEAVSDTAPVLIAAGAELTVCSDNGKQKTMPVSNLYSGDGVRPKSIGKSMLLTQLHIPIPAPRIFFKKLRRRKSLEFTSLTMAMALREETIHIVLCGVDPKPVALAFDKKESRDNIINRTRKSCRVVENDIMPRSYRIDMINLFVTQGLNDMEL